MISVRISGTMRKWKGSTRQACPRSSQSHNNVTHRGQVLVYWYIDISSDAELLIQYSGIGVPNGCRCLLLYNVD